MPWIHVDDWAVVTSRLIAEPGATGPFNLTAPEPVTNADFTRALGRALHRPVVFPVPAFALELALGSCGGSIPRSTSWSSPSQN